jgi:hypothetical protein
MEKRAQTTEQFQTYLEEQIGFLEVSAAAFDSGAAAEAKRLAVTIRTLVHDNPDARPPSKSLLTLLARKETMDWWDTALHAEEGAYQPNGSLVGYDMHRTPPRYLACLDNTPTKRQVGFDEWWSGEVFKSQTGHVLTRKNLILYAANKTGGAHVDPELPESYAALAVDNSPGLKANDPNIIITAPGLVAIRQVTHEVLKSLKPGYTKVPDYTGSGPIQFVTITPLGNGPQAVPAPPPKIGRNARCYCGNGRKYKHCHGR